MLVKWLNEIFFSWHLKEKTPKRTIIGKRGHLTWTSEDMDNLTEELEKPLSPKKMKLSRMNSREEKTTQINSECRAGQRVNRIVAKNITTSVVTWPKCIKLGLRKMHKCCLAFSVSIKALEPYFMSEWPWYSHSDWRGNIRSKLLQGLCLEAWIRSVDIWLFIFKK